VGISRSCSLFFPCLRLPACDCVCITPVLTLCTSDIHSVQGIKAENKHGGTYGMLRDGEDRVFGELWRKAGPQARPNNFLIGALPRYGGHVSAEIQWARKLETLTSNGPQV